MSGSRSGGDGRIGRWAWVGAAGFALLVAAPDASADTIYLNARGVAQREQISQGIQPARLFDDSNGVYLRCRIVSATPAAWGSGLPTLQVEAWSPVGPDRYVWSAQPYTIDMSFVRSVEHEVDSHLDLQLMLSSRDEPDAPMGSPEWRARILRVLDPAGALPDETPDERRAVTRPGWILHQLVDDPSPVLPDTTGPGGDRLRAEFDRLQQERRQRMEAELRADGLDALHPRRVGQTARQAIWGLIEGMARAEKFRFLADRQARADQPPRVPPRASASVARSFVERATIAAGFLCTLSEVPAPERTDPRALIEPATVRYARFGFEARDALLTVLEAADPDHLVVGTDPREIDEYARRMDADGASALAAQLKARSAARMDPAAVLALDPADSAMAAMRVLTEFETFWYADADARRVARALLRLARKPAAARYDLGLKATETLVRMLRPDMVRTRTGASAMKADEAEVRGREAGRFRAVLDEFVTDPDPEVRAAVQRVMAHAGLVPVSTDAAIDELFSLATGEGVPMDAPREVKRASRRYAITVLTVLGGLADPRVPASEEDRAVAERVFGRLQVVRDRVEGGFGTEGQRELLDMLPDLPERVDEPNLRVRIGRFLRFEADHVRARHGRARMMLEEAANGTRVLSDEDRVRYFEEARRLGRRLDHLRVPDSTE